MLEPPLKFVFHNYQQLLLYIVFVSISSSILPFKVLSSSGNAKVSGSHMYQYVVNQEAISFVEYCV